MEIKGFVIIGPNGRTGLEGSTFGRNITEAWHRHMQTKFGDPDAIMLRSRWAQKGWRPAAATISIEED